MRNLISALLVNYKLLPMAKTDFTLFGMPARCSFFSIIKIRYSKDKVQVETVRHDMQSQMYCK